MPSTLQPTRMDRLKTAKTKLYSVNPSTSNTTGTALNTRQMLGIDPPRRGTYLLTVVFTATVSFVAGYRYFAVKVDKSTTSTAESTETDHSISSLAIQRDVKNQDLKLASAPARSATSNASPKLDMSLSLKKESSSQDAVTKAGRFAFDSAELNVATKTLLDDWSVRLKKNPSLRIKISGHADDRGSLRYNDSLAEDRANVARRYLLAKGAKHYQIKIASFGKRRPLIVGDKENVRAQNRRIEIVELKKSKKKSEQAIVGVKHSAKSTNKSLAQQTE